MKKALIVLAVIFVICVLTAITSLAVCGGELIATVIELIKENAAAYVTVGI